MPAKKKKYFVFMDESGNTKEEQFFWLWLLFVPIELVWYIYDDLKSFFDRAKDIAKAKKNEKILEYITEKHFDKLAKITTSTRDFELKFKNINFTNKDIYKWIVDKYFSYNWIKFSSLIIDKKNGSEKYNYRDLYIFRASMLLANTIKSEPDAEYVLICDWITQPKSITKKFEESMKDSILHSLDKKWISPDTLFGVLREESHACLLLQLVDIILGATMYFTKEKQWLISEKVENKKWFIARTLQSKTWSKNFTESFTITTPSYFSVWHFESSKMGHGQETRTH